MCIFKSQLLFWGLRGPFCQWAPLTTYTTWSSIKYPSDGIKPPLLSKHRAGNISVWRFPKGWARLFLPHSECLLGGNTISLEVGRDDASLGSLFFIYGDRRGSQAKTQNKNHLHATIYIKKVTQESVLLNNMSFRGKSGFADLPFWRFVSIANCKLRIANCLCILSFVAVHVCCEGCESGCTTAKRWLCCKLCARGHTNATCNAVVIAATAGLSASIFVLKWKSAAEGRFHSLH